MSYLKLPRLAFTGQFLADPSTVNNDPEHFNNKTFKPEYQDYGTDDSPNGWWNPDGTGNWRFMGCTISSVTYADGTSTSNPKEDPIIGMSIMDTDDRVPGKMVDLDSQQQMVSQIWGVIVRIVNGESELMKGDYEVAAFTDLWFSRSTDLSKSMGASASYRSVIKNISWAIDKSPSRYLKELKAASLNELSIQFVVDRYSTDRTSPQFTLGRIAGTIGPSLRTEPEHFALGRNLFPVPNSNLNYAIAIVNTELSNLTLDLGNSLQFKEGGKVAETRDLALAVNKGTDEVEDFTILGKIEYSAPKWYETSAGICSFDLNPEHLKLANAYPLVILDIQTNHKDVQVVPSTENIVFNESAYYVRADQFVFRMNPGETCKINFYAIHLGKPLANKTINLTSYIKGFNPPTPVLGTPNILNYPNSVVTDENGMATVTVKAGDPKNPRKFIDGQLYGIIYSLEDNKAVLNPANFVSILVFDSLEKTTINNPTWKDIQPVMQQYANLYPLMSKGVFNLAKQEVVNTNAEILKFVFSKDHKDPNYMPATRDLSRDKQQMIINYLDAIIHGQGPKDNITTRIA